MRSLLLIDLSAIFWANYHATANESASAAFELTVGKVHQLTTPGELCAICCDCPPYTRRKELHPGYKANREAAPPAALGQLRRVKERLEADGFLLWEVAGFEADDVIATAVGFAAREAEPLEVTIASGDKDLAQLVSDTNRVVLVNPLSGVRLDGKGVFDKFGVPPQLVRDLLAFTGDKSDNVPGIPGIGPVKAAKLLEQFGDLEGVLAGAEQVTQPAMKKALLEHADAARLAFKLVGLYNDVPLDFDAVFAERKPKPLAAPPSDAELDALDEDEEDALLDEVMPAPPTGPAGYAKAESKDPRQEAGIQRTHEVAASAVVDAPAPAVPAIQTKREETAITPAPSYELALQPRSISAAAALARGLENSRLYTKFQGGADAITAVILRGREMGLPALTALDCFQVIEGKPALSAHLIIERAKAHPDCEYFQFVDGDDTFAEWECKSRRNPRPTKLRYTIEQAKQAGLCPEEPRPRPVGGDRDRRSQWEKRPFEMLRKTAAVQLARLEFPGAALGLYAAEELDPEAA